MMSKGVGGMIGAGVTQAQPDGEKQSEEQHSSLH